VKKHLLTSYSILSIFLITITGSCTKKGILEPVTLDQAAGTWSINAIRFKITYGAGPSKDSTVPWKPAPSNYVTFDGVSNMNYCFNQTNSFTGKYNLIGSDSITMSFIENNRLSAADSVTMAILDENSRWKILLLTSTNFNIEKTSTNNKSFPGATVVTYQGFVR
jgi:hypothetical protein